MAAATTTANRGRDGVLGAIVGDAAGLGTHWLYKDNGPEDVAGGPNVAFAAADEQYTKDNKFCFYAHGGKQIGDLTHRGEGLLVTLRTLAKTGLRWNRDSYLEEFTATYGFGGSWSGWVDHSSKVTLLNVLNKQLGPPQVPTFGLTTDQVAKVRYIFGEARKGRPNPTLDQLVKAGVDELASKWQYKDGEEAELKPKLEKLVAELAADFLKPAQGDPNDKQVHALIANLPLWGLVELTADEVENAVRVEQDNDESVAAGRFFYRLAREVVAGAKVEDVLKGVRDWPEVRDAPFVAPLVSKAFDGVDQDHKAFVKEHGKSCLLTGIIPGVVHALLKFGTDYERAIQETLRAGGDNSARAAFIGFLISASEGFEAVPRQWRLKTRWIENATELIAKAGEVQQ